MLSIRITQAVLCILVAQATYTLAEEEKVVSYNADSFEDSIKTNNHFVMFYAPWCGHCKRLHPVWEELAGLLNDGADSKVTIAKVDCTSDHDLCSSHDVTGYPTLKFFKLGAEESVKFKGTRDLSSLTSFINEQLGSLGAVPDSETAAEPTVEKGLLEFTEGNFDSATKNGNHFVKFYAPWCGHCQKLAPTWEELAESLESNDEVSIGKVDCTVHRSVCNSLEIKGYPTLLFLKDGSVAEKYTGQRSLEDLQGFVRRMLGGSEEVEEAATEEEPALYAGVPLLNADTFSSGVADGLTFVKFFAPWCGHCKRLAPTWTELSLKIKDTPNVRLVSVDCTQGNSKELCNEQEVEGFPTLLVYRNGEKVSEYNGRRNVDDMYQFLAKYFQHDEL